MRKKCLCVKKEEGCLRSYLDAEFIAQWLALLLMIFFRSDPTVNNKVSILAGDTCCTLCENLSFFATALVRECIEGETSHYLLTWGMAKLSPDL